MNHNGLGIKITTGRGRNYSIFIRNMELPENNANIEITLPDEPRHDNMVSPFQLFQNMLASNNPMAFVRQLSSDELLRSLNQPGNTTGANLPQPPLNTNVNSNVGSQPDTNSHNPNPPNNQDAFNSPLRVVRIPSEDNQSVTYALVANSVTEQLTEQPTEQVQPTELVPPTEQPSQPIELVPPTEQVQPTELVPPIEQTTDIDISRIVDSSDAENEAAEAGYTDDDAYNSYEDSEETAYNRQLQKTIVQSMFNTNAYENQSSSNYWTADGHLYGDAYSTALKFGTPNREGLSFSALIKNHPNSNTILQKLESLELYREIFIVFDEWIRNAMNSTQTHTKYRSTLRHIDEIFGRCLLKFPKVLTNDEYADLISAFGMNTNYNDQNTHKLKIIISMIREGSLDEMIKLLNPTGCECTNCLL